MRTNLRQMPMQAPAPNPTAFTAPCECCGQVHAVTCHEKDPSQELLVEIATKDCYCDGAKRKRVMERAKERIPELFGEKCSPVYGGPVHEKVLPWLLEGALLSATGHVTSMTIKLNDQEVATFKGGHETVEITRKRTKQAKSKI